MFSKSPLSRFAEEIEMISSAVKLRCGGCGCDCGGLWLKWTRETVVFVMVVVVEARNCGGCGCG